MSFEKQNLKLTNAHWRVELNYDQNQPSSGLEKNFETIIELNDADNFISSSLEINLTRDEIQKSSLIKGIQGSTYLNLANEKEKSQTVLLDEDNLIVSIGVHFFSFNLTTLSLNWKLEPDMAEVFEFYDFQGDYLLRGEVEIHRIDKSGNIKWSYGGKDIWVNMEGKSEINIEENAIRLFDFNSDEYLIDFNGKTIKS